MSRLGVPRGIRAGGPRLRASNRKTSWRPDSNLQSSRTNLQSPISLPPGPPISNVQCPSWAIKTNDGLRGACNPGEGREALEKRPLLLLRRMARAQDRPRTSKTGPACWWLSGRLSGRVGRHCCTRGRDKYNPTYAGPPTSSSSPPRPRSASRRRRPWPS